MLYVEIIINLGMLVAMTTLSGFIDKRKAHETTAGMLLQGILFGLISAVGMFRPIPMGPGLLCDGRSVVLSICALFFGPWSTAIAAAFAITFRLLLGGAGAATGILVIIVASAAGLAARSKIKIYSPVSASDLYVFGLIVNASTIFVMFIPTGMDGVAILKEIGLPIMLIHPLATILAGKIISDHILTIRTMDQLKKAQLDMEHDRQQTMALMKARISLMEHTAGKTVDELLVKALDEVSELVESPIAFYHFVDYDQEELSLQQWSTLTLKNFCRAEGKGLHYNIGSAGVWAECIREKKAVVHNDYLSLPDRKGLPEGHAELVRELVVPVMREKRVVAVLGVGNKSRDYTDKDVETVSYIADLTWHIVEKKRDEEAIRQSANKYRNLFENAPIGIFTSTSKGEVKATNRAMASALGFRTTEEAILHYADLQKTLYVNPEKRALFIEELKQKGKVENFEYEAFTADKRVVWLRMNARIAEEMEDGSFTIEGFTTDISDQRRAEEQFRQAQKIESVGRLAGGVAHDYNNMLGVIIGYAELALSEVSDGPIRDIIKEILKAARRSADVTRQLLAFARKQAIEPKVMDLNRTVEGMLKMLARLIGENIRLKWLPSEKALWPIKMDPSQIDQILANLCVNARDAIKDNGTITIETDIVTFDNTYCLSHIECTPGDFVMLAVSDDGSGMDRETREMLFEPFFTTKGIGKGTGLGLSTIYGIVKQNEGFINVYSEPGRGSTFRIYFRREISDSCDFDCIRNIADNVSVGNGETLLIVEDEPAILNMAVEMLTMLGYIPLPAGDVSQAIELANMHSENIKLLITDVIMPEMNGKELARRVKNCNPHISVLYMSGYTANVIAHHGVLDEGVLFLQKPFSMKDLSDKVAKALEKTSRAPETI